MINTIPGIVIGNVTCTLENTEEGAILTADNPEEEIVFEQEYMLPLHLLSWDGEKLTMTIAREADNCGLQIVDVPEWTQKLVVWGGCYYFACGEVGGYKLVEFPKGYKFWGDAKLPRLR
ncbi:hypothetical protein MK805_09325 [Shimazuella sp. AN120528]|uniref:hypothetical protein n=1 Tax=Shimazuella soli TaxID=1892854 RepID=UPI001F0F764E|nr:hypothetical protein [Shimazuella soli]MCH5585170.1 hypothetical protein [Shimazuella soli]